MNHWPYIIAAYAIVLLGTAITLAASYSAMRRSERRANELSRRK